MAARRPHEAVQDYIEHFQQIASCISKSIFQVSSYNDLATVHSLTLNRGNPILLGGRTDLTLRIRQEYQIVKVNGATQGRFTINLEAYAYRIGDGDSREIVAYHWHPSPPTTVKEPHFHLGPAAQIGRNELTKAHLASGHIRLEDVICMLIREFGVKPLRHDWEDVLSRDSEGSLSLGLLK